MDEDEFIKAVQDAYYQRVQNEQPTHVVLVNAEMLTRNVMRAMGKLGLDMRSARGLLSNQFKLIAIEEVYDH